MLHPTHNQPGHVVNLLLIVIDPPFNRLTIMPGWGMTGHGYHALQQFSIRHRGFKPPYGAPVLQKQLKHPRVWDLISIYRRTFFGGHAGMTQGTRRTDSHTMAAADTPAVKVLDWLHKGQTVVAVLDKPQWADPCA
jgi:hypothetical protein